MYRAIQLLSFAATLVAARPPYPGFNMESREDLPTDPATVVYWYTLLCNPYESGARWLPMEDDGDKIGFKTGIDTICDPANNNVGGPHKANEEIRTSVSSVAGKSVVSTWGEKLELALTISSDVDWTWPPVELCKAAMKQFTFPTEAYCYGLERNDSLLGSFKDEISGLTFSVVAKEIQ